MKTYLIQLICWGSLLTVLSACRSKDPEVMGAIIETAIPNGLVPGSALTLKGRDFGMVQSVAFANTTVAIGSFIRTAVDFGSVFKNWNVVGYSTDGSELRLCRPVNDANRYINYPCVQTTCDNCL